MSRFKDWLLAGAVLVVGRRRPPRGDSHPRIVPEGAPSRGAENAVMALFALAALSAIAFPVVFGLDLQPRTQYLGLSLGGALVFLGAAGIVIGKKLVVTEEIAEEYPVPAHPDEVEIIDKVVEESGSRITRKRLLIASGGAAAGALGLAALTPAVSFGPVFDMDSLYYSGWFRGRRLVDEEGKPYRASDIEESDFYTAYPENGLREAVWAPLVVIRLKEDELDLPSPRQGWAPHGILAYSKICTHAGCAISLYRKPTFPPLEPRPALVCPCHYSTFDPSTGGVVLFGPAGRRLPQLPLMVGADGYLRAAGNFSEPVGPSWWGVRMGDAQR